TSNPAIFSLLYVCLFIGGSIIARHNLGNSFSYDLKTLNIFNTKSYNQEVPQDIEGVIVADTVSLVQSRLQQGV
ncbi:MAG TPA: hypothetical protein VJL89_06880, partial [Thermodesulfovibrionia bacterium]|nr:hypothetical protein [Thermodesulfovibrionia bacterium]